MPIDRKMTYAWTGKSALFVFFLMSPAAFCQEGTSLYSLEDAHMVKEIASSHIKNKQYDQAILLLEPYVEEVPTDYPALQLLGLSYIQSDEPERAGSVFQQAYDLSPLEDEPLMQFYMGWAYIRLGKFERAYELLEESVKSEKFWAKQSKEHYLMLLQFLISKYVREKDYEKARLFYERISAVEPKQAPWVEYQLGLMYAHAAMNEKAKEHWGKVLELSPDSTLALRAKERLEALGRGGWNYRIPMGGELFWDSNPSLYPAEGNVRVEGTLDPVASNTKSWGQLFYLRPRLQRLVEIFGNDLSLHGLYLLEGKHHGSTVVRSLDSMNQLWEGGLLWYVTDDFPSISLLSDYSYNLYLTNREGLAPQVDAHAISAGLNWIPDPMFVTELRHRYRWLNFYAESAQNRNSRDGSEASFGGTQSIRLFNYRWTLFGSYFYRINHRRGVNFESSVNEFDVGLRSPILWDFQFLGDMLFTWRTFHHHERGRYDVEQAYNAKLRYLRFYPLELYVRFHDTSNYSTIRQFRYMRQVYAGGISYTF